MMYSAMSHTKREPLVTTDADNEHAWLQWLISPFWAVMLAGRSDDDMVNMVPCLEEYKFPAPNGKEHGDVKCAEFLKLNIPFLTNTRQLKSGELLVLPFDGGLQQIVCETYPPIDAI